MKFLIINGPNINMIGIREVSIYGKEDYSALLALCQKTCDDLNVEAEFFQSNHEGAIVDCIQSAYQLVDGIVINPAAYTHTSIAILDALKAVAIPCVEIHLSKLETREDFRQISYPGLACFKTITGLGIQGYEEAIKSLYKKVRGN